MGQFFLARPLEYVLTESSGSNARRKYSPSALGHGPSRSTVLVKTFDHQMFFLRRGIVKIEGWVFVGLSTTGCLLRESKTRQHSYWQLDDHQCSITFKGEDGCTLSGTFVCDAFGRCELIGIKLGMISLLEESYISINEEWDQLFDYGQ
jgi:hypothetical protein